MFFPRRPMTPMNPPSMFSNPFGFPQQMPQPKPGLGGLLSRLIPGMGNSKNMQTMGGMSSFMNQASQQGMNPGILQNLANPANLSTMMGNVQKTLKMAESVVPVVQQYGPLVKNLPAMIKMYSALKNADSEDDEKEETFSIDDLTETESENNKSKSKPKSTGSGQSVPKLYV